MSDLLNVSVDDGKYTVVQGSDGSLKVLRYGKKWRNCSGDNLIFFLASELEEAQTKLAKVKATIKLADEWSADQSNGITTGSVCIAALKDIRRIVKE